MDIKQTAMQKHLEWLKGRMVISHKMEKQLLEEEKQQIIDAYKYDNHYTLEHAEQYYNETFNR